VNAWPERRRPPLGTLLSRAGAWLVEPAAPPTPPRAAQAAPPDVDPPRPVVAVLGLAPRAGASTIARAVAASLAAFDPARAAVLHTAHPPRGVPASAAAARLSRSLEAAGCDSPRPAGRLCVVAFEEPLAPLAASRAAPIVADLRHGEPADGAIALSDHVVLVGSAEVEPALAGAVATSLRESGVSASTVLNRVLGDRPPGLDHALVVPESRVAAQLTLACREPRGALAAVATELAERALAEVWR
jgi:hypothetical protein